VESYARKANRIVVRTTFGELVASIDLVSPGNKDGKHAITAFVEKAVEFLSRGVNLQIIDLFPPTPRDPLGIHKLIWDEFREEPYDLPPDKPLTIAAYEGFPEYAAYVESVGVGDALPDSPLFIARGRYVPVPLEATYLRTWARIPPPGEGTRRAELKDQSRYNARGRPPCPFTIGPKSRGTVSRLPPDVVDSFEGRVEQRHLAEGCVRTGGTAGRGARAG
jgi:hypothetical protein